MAINFFEALNNRFKAPTPPTPRVSIMNNLDLGPNPLFLVMFFQLSSPFFVGEFRQLEVSVEIPIVLSI